MTSLQALFYSERLKCELYGQCHVTLKFVEVARSAALSFPRKRESSLYKLGCEEVLAACRKEKVKR